VKPLNESLKTRRELFGLTQVELAHASGVSLPSIQNLEAGKGNPSMQTLEPLLRALGMELEIRSQGADWAVLAELGLPLTAPSRSRHAARARRDPETLVRHLALAAAELAEPGEAPDRERKREAVEATLLAIQHHFPSFYEKRCKRVPALRNVFPTEVTGRLIKLKRQALASVAEYL
jgi:transcriptional regulator with XRE-family HTH domain